MELVYIVMIVLILIILLNNLLKKTNYYKNKFIDTYKFKGEIPINIDIVNLGSNQPKFAFEYNESKKLGMNWAVGPQSFEYDYKVLNQYHSYLKDNANVIIPICPFSFFFLHDKNITAHHKYYQFLDTSLIDNFSKKTKRLYIDYPILTAKKQLLRIIKDVKPDKRLEHESNPMSDEEIKKDAQKWVDGWKRQFKVDDFSSIELSDENKTSIVKNIEILKEMIDFCLERDYKAVLLVLPVTKELSSLFPDTFVEKYIMDYIKQSNEKEVTFLNYWKDERFESKENYFNSFFMNKVGRKKFTEQVIRDLND